MALATAFRTSFTILVWTFCAPGCVTWGLILDGYSESSYSATPRFAASRLPWFRVIYQPVYSPWVNHVERLCQALHETITRNHQCCSMWQLLKKVRHFMDTVSPSPVENMGWLKSDSYTQVAS
uniref:Putative transposase n=1 Tax=Escherichia coli TaxID=562 RepID=Q08JB0_ECOLX|nr:putative transposase [Escherichia coli]